jgi:hypothetical protein
VGVHGWKLVEIGQILEIVNDDVHVLYKWLDGRRTWVKWWLKLTNC